MLSGIGPGEHLQEFGIDVVVDSPGVGANLDDHVEGIVQWDAAQADGHAPRRSGGRSACSRPPSRAWTGPT